MRNYDEGSRSGYIELPVPAAYVKWSRGDAKLASIKKEDPAAYFGGWRAFLQHKEKGSDVQVENPKLPLPVVERVSENGQHLYKVYATNVLSFLPLNWRLRYEFREKIKDEQTGRETEKIVATSQDKQPGYQPNKQIFGLVFNSKTNDYAPAVLFVSTWSAFISMNKAAGAWKKIKAPEGQILIRRYGSIGVTKDGSVTPNFEVYGQGRSTPIDALGTDRPRFIADSPEFDKLFDDSIAWKNCGSWNAEGKSEEPEESSTLVKFMAACDEIGLSNVEIAQIVKENGGNYHKALAAVTGQFEADAPAVNDEVAINQAFADGEDTPF